MRIWSKKLITSGVLPTKQLKSMRYELGNMIKQYPNIKHPLVKFANNYDVAYLWDYFRCVLTIMDDRNIKHSESYDDSILNIVKEKSKYNSYDIFFKDFLFKEDNEEYLQICRWNLFEKSIRNIITDEEWQKIEDFMKECKK